MGIIPYPYSQMKSSKSWTQARSEKIPAIFYSTFAPQAVISLVLDYYTIDLPKNCQFWHRGLSDIYLLETLTEAYIFRISHHHWRSKTEIDFELELLDFLANDQIPVASPLKTKNGHLSLEIDAPEGTRYAALFPYAPGEIALGDFNITQSRILGTILAKLHQTSQKFKPLAHRQPLNTDYLLEQSLQIIAPFLHQRPADLKFLVTAIANIKQQIKLLPIEPPYWVICWGDPHSGNVHITLDNQMTLFDFDQCGYGWRIFDLAKFLQVSLQTGLSRRVREAFIDGYQSVTVLTTLELNTLQALTQAAYIWSWSISLNMTKLNDFSRLDPYYFTQRLEKLKHFQSPDWQLF
jgi:Ser/Thr protein kinase RdoA (MazF antagonist)